MYSIDDDGPVRWITITNPQRRNAIPFDQWVPLAGHLGEFERSGQKALVITGAGQDFCSGADLAGDFSERATAAGAYRMMLRVAEAARALHHLSRPTLAAVDGVAVGAGMNLALGCDLVVATSRARFSEIFVRRGLTLDFGGTWLLPRRVGMARAKELALTGRIFGAEEALGYGIVTEVVAPEELRSRAGEIAAQLAAGPPGAQRLIKRGLDRSFEMSFEEALEYESQAQALCLSSEDVIEGVSAFLERRDPRFEGR